MAEPDDVDARGALHQRLEACAAERDWPRALEVLAELAAQEAMPVRRARFHFAAAVIARDELDDSALAIAELDAALDADPRTASAFDALDQLWLARGDGRRRVGAYRRQIERLGDGAPDELAALWWQVGEQCLALGDGDAAAGAFQVACELVPADLARREQLIELHLAGGDARRRDAIAELQILLGHDPGRIDLYRALAALYLAEGELDKAWCVAEVLVVLGTASADERALHARFATPRYVQAERRISDELWRKAIAHPREDRRIGAILAAALPALAADTAQPPAAFGLAPEGRVDLEHEPRAIGRMLRHACRVLAIDPPPSAWFDPAAAGLRIANVLDGERARPAVIVGMPELAAGAGRTLAFAVGQRLAYLRPERLAALVVATLPRLEAVVAALAGGDPGDDPGDHPARRSTARLIAQLPAAVRDQIAELADAAWRPGDGAVAAWRAATDLTANRAGLVLAGDLETAARAIAVDGAAPGLGVKDRLRDLFGYAASESYFAVRRHLGRDVGGRVDGGDASISEP